MTGLAFLYGIITLFLFGIPDALSAIPTRRMSPIVITLIIDITSVILFGFLSIFFWHTYVWDINILFSIAAGFAAYTGFLFFVYSLKTGSVGVSASIANAYPILSILFGFLVFSERFNIYEIAALALILIGVFGISTKFSLRGFSGNSIRSKSVMFALLAMLFWGVQVILMKYAIVQTPTFQVTHVMSMSSLVSALAIFYLSGRKLVILKETKRTDLFVIISLSLMYFTGIYTLNMALSLGQLGVSSAIAGAAPFVSAIFAYVFFKERLSGKEWLSILLVVIGLVVLGVAG